LMEDGRPRPSPALPVTDCHFERSEKAAFCMGTADSSRLKAFGMTIQRLQVSNYVAGNDRIHQHR
jgi:hypothetical protein